MTYSRRFFVHDRKIPDPFLADCGAEISAVPPTPAQRLKPTGQYLYAANRTKIAIYGEKRLPLDLGLRRDFTWNFIIADIQHPILGADFLSHYDLLPDLRNRRLIDQLTLLSKLCSLRNVVYSSVSIIDSSLPFAKLLQEFPMLTNQTVKRRCTEKNGW